jgi:hypothetical protein
MARSKSPIHVVQPDEEPTNKAMNATQKLLFSFLQEKFAAARNELALAQAHLDRRQQDLMDLINAAAQELQITGDTHSFNSDTQEFEPITKPAPEATASPE